MKPVEDLYVWHYQNERYLRNEQSLARVALVYSQQTAMFYGGEQARAKVEDHALGFYQALVEARIPFDMVHDHLLDPAHISRYRTLILPNIAALSTAQCRQIEDYVRAGGNIVATRETSLYDEWGIRRPDFGLASLFDASFAGRVDTDVHNSYLNINKDPQTGAFHRIVHGLEDATRIINGVNWVQTRPSAPMHSPLTLVPSYPDLPMEEVWARVPHSDIPGLYAREFGRGRVVYFPFDLDRTYWDILSPDHGLLLKNAVAWAHRRAATGGARQGRARRLPLAAKGIHDRASGESDQSMMMKDPVTEIIPSPPQHVRIRIPEGRHLRRVTLLVRRKRPVYRSDGNVITLELPSIDLHEVIAFDLT